MHEITKDSIVADVLRDYPDCIEVLSRHGMSCQACMGVSTDTIAEAAMLHDVDADRIIDELRECRGRSGDAGNSTPQVSS